MDGALTRPEPPTGTFRQYWARVGREIGWWYLVGGLVGSVAMAISGSALIVSYDGSIVKWWFGVVVPPSVGQVGNYLACYAGMLALSGAWFGALRRVRRSSILRCRDLLVVGALWACPLVVGPPLFSRDVYSYLAQGMLAHLQLSPYVYSPNVLGVTGFGNLLAAVSPVWRLTTAPYGPLFVSMAAWLAGMSGGHITGGAFLLRLPELAGIALIAATLPPLARRMGADPREALWVGAASPLVLFELLSAAHNDALMVGLLMVGLLLAVDRRPLLGVAMCSLGTLVKVPALLGVAFIAWTWARERPDLRGKAGALGLAAGVSAAVLAAGSALTAGFGWASSQLVTVPDKVSIPVSPSQSFASLIHLVSQQLGFGWSHVTISSLVRAVGMVIGAMTILAILRRARVPTLVPSLGAAMIVGVLLGTDIWPWYLTWGVVPLAAWRPAQRSWLLLVAMALFDFVITPAGQLVVPNKASPAVALVWLVLAVVAWRSIRGSGPRQVLRRRQTRLQLRQLRQLRVRDREPTGSNPLADPVGSPVSPT
jgi:hypothetical protein